MKRIKTLLITIAILSPSVMMAQGAYDALRFSQNFYEGTARTISMGNAFTALGGDLGAISINPASSGVYKYSVLTFTPSLISSYGSSDYLGVLGTDSNTRLAISNFAFVSSFETGNYSGLKNFNIGIAVNRNASYNSIMFAEGNTNETSWLGEKAVGLSGVNTDVLNSTSSYDPYYDSNISWSSLLAWDNYLLANFDGTTNYIASTENIDDNTGDIYVGGDLHQQYYRKTTGGNTEFAINFGCNFSDIAYFGANLNVYSLEFTQNETYSEESLNSLDFQDGFDYFSHSFWLKTVGTGVNLKLGTIIRPFDNLRIGATITTPTWFSMRDDWQESMSSSFDNGNSYYNESPTGTYYYQLTTPMRFSFGLAYTFGKYGLISADYERVDYSTAKLKDDNGNTNVFSTDNQYIKSNFGASNIFRIGGELRLIEGISLRAGYSQYGNAEKDYKDYKFVSGGVGFTLGRQGKTFLDLAYQRMINASEVFSLYNDYGGLYAPSGTYKNRCNKLLLTLGFKF